jgi:hypothetical protein
MKPLSCYFTPKHNNISGFSPVYSPSIPPPGRQPLGWKAPAEKQREEQATALWRIEKILASLKERSNLNSPVMG